MDDPPAELARTGRVQVGGVAAELDPSGSRRDGAQPAHEVFAPDEGVVGQAPGDARTQATGRGRDLGLRTVRREDGTGGEEARERVVRDARDGRPRRDPIDQVGEVDGAAVDPDPVLLLDAGDRGRSGQAGARVVAQQVIVGRCARRGGEGPGCKGGHTHDRLPK
ncbi:MAG: hypothetical protein C0498_05335 [Anaerolinea sp.]|nr:hypothetical protein [Anaerolinea sp.]